MKKVIEKTEKEREREVTCQTMEVRNLNMFYVYCSKCKVAYFYQDAVKICNDGYNRCSKCDKKVYGGDEESFHHYYKIAE